MIAEDFLTGSDIAAIRRYWGTLQPLGHVRVLEHMADAWLKRVARVSWEFWSADWTPWWVIVRLRQDWPGLMFNIRPDHENDAGAGG